MISKKSIAGRLLLVLSSTAGAQIISLLLMPLITRLYEPDIFGAQSVFLSIIAMITPLGALALPLAIILSDDRNETDKLLEVNFIISVVIFFIILFLFYLLKNFGHDFLSVNNLGWWGYSIPFYLLIITWADILKKDMIKRGNYSEYAKANIASSIVTNASKYIGGYINPTISVLLFSINISNVISTINCYQLNRIKISFRIRFNELKDVLNKFADFPKYRCPQMLINAISQDLPIVILSTNFGLKSAAYYGLCRTILTAPINLLGNSINTVLYPKFVEIKESNSALSRLLTKSTAILAIISFIPFLCVILFGSDIFGIIFGEQWIIAGIYAKWLSLLCFFILVSRPAISVIPVIRIQKEFLIIEMVSFVLRISSLLYGVLYYNDEILSVSLFCVTSSFIYIFIIFFVFVRVKKFKS
ncbi:oligosaccharide flippase family protein [Vibrio cholerae]|uniref:Putative translocase n=1 Tax=Vibrio cholerae TaxID=666 RepID=A0T1U1_VIBCL|nr:putative translocase [Vibrio cholerae]ELJ8501921.1 oligosaccharide flippase family protein [Vibrio cholerae]